MKAETICIRPVCCVAPNARVDASAIGVDALLPLERKALEGYCCPGENGLYLPTA